MNKIMLLTISTLLFASCKKENTEPEGQRVTYKVECDYCLVSIEDNNWNRTSEIERGKQQQFVVSGVWEYYFINKNLDSASLTIFTSVFQHAQKVKASISTSDGKYIEIDEVIGFNFPQKYIYDKRLDLKLKNRKPRSNRN